MPTSRWKWVCLTGFCLTFYVASASAADQAQWGERYTRNNVSQERGLPEWFDPGKRDASGNIDLATTSNVKWVARLGNVTYATPVVAERFTIPMAPADYWPT